MSEWAEPAVIACACGATTVIGNTRGRVSKDAVWRQRKCVRCGTVFSTVEHRGTPGMEATVDSLRLRLLDTIEQARAMLENLPRV